MLAGIDRIYTGPWLRFTHISPDISLHDLFCFPAMENLERTAGNRRYIRRNPRFRSEKSAADANLEKISLSAGGFLWVSY